jgi:hypothetical protein
MKILAASLLIAFFAYPTFAQKTSKIEFGKIPMADLEMKVYDKDSSASAVILCDVGQAYLKSTATSYRLNIERHTRIKILRKEGLEWANISIPIFQEGSGRERISELKAATYNLENGKTKQTKLSKAGIFKKKITDNITITELAFPEVIVGSVIELTYTVVSEFITNFPSWKFQSTIPTRLSQYAVVLPNVFGYQKYMKGQLPVDYKPIDINGKAILHTWAGKDIPAFKPEPLMPFEEDFIPTLNFVLTHIALPGQIPQKIIGSWRKLNTELLDSEYFGKVISGSNFLKKPVEETLAGITDTVQQIIALHNYVKQTIEWNGEKTPLASDLKKVLELKKGSSGDINFLLASMLDKAGLDVEMVLLSTRDHGVVNENIPMINQFNYVFCLVRLAHKAFWVDGTDKFMPINTLPLYCQNTMGLIISKDNHKWIDLESKTKVRSAVTAEVTLDSSGELKGKLELLHDGYDAIFMRNDFHTKGQEVYLKDFVSNKVWQVGKSEYQNIKEIDQPAREIHEVLINDHATIAGNIMHINPFITSQLESNPFVPERRQYPIDFGAPIEKNYILKLTIPQEYEVDELPIGKVIALPENTARYLFNVTQIGNTINISSKFQINKSVFTSEEYPNLRELFNLVITKQAEQIVLKKK